MNCLHVYVWASADLLYDPIVPISFHKKKIKKLKKPSKNALSMNAYNGMVWVKDQSYDSHEKWKISRPFVTFHRIVCQFFRFLWFCIMK